jgi:hypothetical protein
MNIVEEKMPRLVAELPAPPAHRNLCAGGFAEGEKQEQAIKATPAQFDR